MKFWPSLCVLTAAFAHPWTVDSLLKIPTFGDPQIRPDGRSYAYVLRTLEGNAWRSTIYIAPIPSGAPQVVGTGTHPRWSPDSARLAYLDTQVRIFDVERRSSRALTPSGSPVVTFCLFGCFS